MDTTEIIHNALEWANKRLELQGEPITENQRNYIVFALRQQLTIPAVVGRSEQLVAFLKWVGDGYDFENNAEKIVREYIDEGN